jgi:8-oxo-dGTP pyrophosphatase MutT (NUDIX family)
LYHEFLTRIAQAHLKEEDHLGMLPNGRKLSSEAKQFSPKIRQAAVGVHCYPNGNSDLNLLLIQRSEYDGKHSGQIAFPGGKMEPSDLDLEFTARRECLEELGIPMDQGQLIRALTPVFIPVSHYEMHPFLFFHHAAPSVLLDTREVVRCMELSLFDLAFRVSVVHRELPLEQNSLFQRSVPGFQHGDCWIWGATALVLNQLKRCIID